MSVKLKENLDKLLLLPVVVLIGFLVAFVAAYLLIAFGVAALYVFYRKKRAQREADALNQPPTQ